MAEELMAFCPECGTPGGGRRFCTSCGASLEAAVQPLADDLLGGDPADVETVDLYASTTHLPATPSSPALFSPFPDSPVPGPPRQRSSAFVPIVVGLAALLLAVAGVGGYLWWQASDDADSSRAREAAATEEKERQLADKEKELGAAQERLDDEQAEADEKERIEAEARAKVEAERRAEERAEAKRVQAARLAADPLSMGEEVANQYCSGDYLVMLASSGTPGDYVSTLRPAFDKAGGEADYLRTSDSCGSFVQKINGNDVYAAYVGPFETAYEACEARGRIGYEGSYVRQLSSAEDRRTPCACEYSSDALPVLSEGDGGAGDVTDSLFVADAQSLLYNAGLNPDREVTGTFGPATDGWVRDFQDDSAWLDSDGVIGRDTWSDLLGYCGVDRD